MGEATTLVIPAGAGNGFIVCECGTPEKPGRILFTVRAPFGVSKGGLSAKEIDQYVARLVHRWNAHESLVKALTVLIDAYGGDDPARDAPIIKSARTALKLAGGEK